MRGRSTALQLGSLLLVLVLASACNGLTGAGDFVIGDGPGGSGTLPDGGRLPDGASGGGDGGGASDGGPLGDATGNATTNPSLDPCGNNQICLPNANGWSPVAFSPTSLGNGCPSEFPQRTDYQTSGGGSCACACSPVGGSCAGAVDSRSGAACGGAATPLPLMSGGCTDMPETLPLPVAFTAHPSGATPTSCGATVDPRLNGPTTAVVCSGATPVPGAACDPGEVCVKKASFVSASLTCIVHDGDVACPKKLDFRTVVGSSVQDGRSCGATCSCEVTGCSSGTLEAFTNPSCSSSIRSVKVDGNCTTFGQAFTGASYRYTAASGCGVKQPAPILGTETYTAPRTVCCTFDL